MPGGFSRCWFSWDFPRSLFIPRGRRFRENFIGWIRQWPARMARIIYHRFIRRKFLGFRRTPGFPSRCGGRTGWFFPRHFLFCGDRADFDSPVIIIAAHITKVFGPTRWRAPWANREKNISAKNIFRSSCKMFIVTLRISQWFSYFFWRTTRGKAFGSRTQTAQNILASRWEQLF